MLFTLFNEKRCDSSSFLPQKTSHNFVLTLWFSIIMEILVAEWLLIYWRALAKKIVFFYFGIVYLEFYCVFFYYSLIFLGLILS